MAEAVTRGYDGAKEAVGEAGHELANNEDLHKGVEFGVKAAGVASKYVAKRVAKDVVLNYAGIDVDDFVGKGLSFGKAAALAGGIQKVAAVNSIYENYQDIPAEGKQLGREFEEVFQDVYKKK